MNRQPKRANDRRIELMRTILSRRRPDLLALLEDLSSGSLTDEDREVLRGVIADELVEYGLDSTDEPTPHGLVLEDLIDWLGRR